MGRAHGGCGRKKSHRHQTPTEQAASPHSRCFQLIGLARIFGASFDRHEPVPRMNGAEVEGFPHLVATGKCTNPDRLRPSYRPARDEEVPARLGEWIRCPPPTRPQVREQGSGCEKRTTTTFPSEVDCGSREENASKHEIRPSVLIQSEPKRL